MTLYKRTNLIIHDYFENFGGGERLVKILHQTKKFDLVYCFKKNDIIKKFKLTKNSLSLNNSLFPTFFKKIFIKKIFEKYLVNTKYKKIIFSGNYSIFAKTDNNCKKIFYCHSLPKLFFYFDKFYSRKNLFLFLINRLFKKKFKKEYIKKLKKMDMILCNSEYTKREIKKKTNLNAKVIYPPIELNKFKWISQKKYFVSNNRHVIGKNNHIIINTFKNFPNIDIYFTSTGPQNIFLKKIAKGYKNIKFTGLLNEKRYAELIGNSSAIINISNFEDFGMAALEGLSAGKPSIVINESGYLETIKNNYNGFVINKNKIDIGLYNFLKEIDYNKLNKMRGNCEKSVRKFSSLYFIRNILSCLNV
jgi:glycosyltransferase involved in cell wall biosynthesis